MSTGSSGCVLKNLFTCEKKCNSVASRKTLLEDFTSKIYDADVIYVDNDGQITEEEYAIIFQLSENQKDKEMIRVHGNAYIKSNLEDPLIKASWSGHYLAKKNGYKMRVVGDNIEKEFHLYCDGNETINFLIKKTASEGVRGTGETSGSGRLSINNSPTCEENCKQTLSCKNDTDCINYCAKQCKKNPNWKPSKTIICTANCFDISNCNSPGAGSPSSKLLNKTLCKNTCSDKCALDPNFVSSPPPPYCDQRCQLAKCTKLTTRAEKDKCVKKALVLHVVIKWPQEATRTLILNA